MKTFVRAEYGPPSVLQIIDVDRPVPKHDEVLVRISASSLNQGDLDYLYGKPFLTRMGTGLRAPRRPGLGFDAAGEVLEVGIDVTRFRPGDAVFAGLTQFGHSAFAEYTVAPERAWAIKPDSISFEEAATLPQAAVLAARGLRGRGGIHAGSRVLVNGASGSVGPFAVQIAKASGAHVTGVCGTRKMAMVRKLGADEVIDYTVEDYTKSGQRYDWIIDVKGNKSILECSSRTGAQGRVRPARMLDVPDPLIAAPRTPDLDGRAKEHRIPVVETLPTRRCVVPSAAHRGRKDQARDRQDVSVDGGP